MTWASASGGGGEKIGEVRMFIGRDNIPAGWEEVGLSVNSPFDNVWSVGPSLLKNSDAYVDSSSSNLFTPAVAMCGVGPSASVMFRSTPYVLGGTAPHRSLRLSDGVFSVFGSSTTGAYPNIAETLPDGSAFFSGGFSSTANTFTSATLKIDSGGVVTTLANAPVTGGGGSGGFISDDELAFFGYGTGLSAATRSPFAYAYSISGNSWRQLADVPRSTSGGKVLRFGDKAYIVGALAVPDYRTVLEYDVLTDTYADAGWVWPGNTTGVRGVMAAKLPSGKYLVLCGATEKGNAGSISTSLIKAFIVGPSGPEYEVSLPSAMNGGHAMLVPNGDSGLPVVLMKRASVSSSSPTVEQIASDGVYLFEENSFEFLSKSSIVYARKLP